MEVLQKKRIGLMTSGGDAQGMNAAVRAVVRTVTREGGEVVGIYDGYAGLMDPENKMRLMPSKCVSGILEHGGTVLGTARCKEMMTPEGRRQAVRSLAGWGIDRLVCVGGDGSLTGAQTLRDEWQEHIEALMASHELPEDTLEKHPELMVVGLPATIDNDLAGTDITIGTDTALHRIVEAIDAIFCTAASHQRTFIVEVMGRHCGYLALMAGLATGAEWVFIPEIPAPDNWDDRLGEALARGRAHGKRAGIVIIAEGARDLHGNTLKSDDVRQVLSEKFHVDARVTILGHVQRGGVPSAYDRTLSTITGYCAAKMALEDEIQPSYIVGMKGNRPKLLPLVETVKKTRDIQKLCQGEGDRGALAARGTAMVEAFKLFRAMNLPVEDVVTLPNPKRIGIMHCGATTPGMNMAVRTAVRWIVAHGHKAIGIKQGFNGLLNPDMVELGFEDVSRWSGEGGAKLGVDNRTPKTRELYTLGRELEKASIDALLVIGGWAAYESVYTLYQARDNYPTFKIPVVCVPTSIDNNLPGCEYSIGCDTAVNAIMIMADMVKRSAVFNKRCFLVETMGYECGYLAAMSGLATGAERIYINEKQTGVQDILKHVRELNKSFDNGRTVAMIMVNERAHNLYKTGALKSIYENEGSGHFDVRQAILGHLQQGGNPTPMDRIRASVFSRHAVDHLIEEFNNGQAHYTFLSVDPDGLKFLNFHDFERYVDMQHRRPLEQWWMHINDIINLIGDL